MQKYSLGVFLKQILTVAKHGPHASTNAISGI
jgi:hypothetical protein